MGGGKRQGVTVISVEERCGGWVTFSLLGWEGSRFCLGVLGTDLGLWEHSDACSPHRSPYHPNLQVQSLGPQQDAFRMMLLLAPEGNWKLNPCY